MSAPDRAPVGLATDVPSVSRCRDLLYWADGNWVYVLATDSNAGIGGRPGDTLVKDPVEVGYSAAKVPLMEVVATGAVPFLLSNALGGPLDGYGQLILVGIRSALGEIDGPVSVTGSDETNIPTRQTAVGVTVLGRARRSALRIGASRPGDVIVAVGLPKDGLDHPYAEGDPDVARLADLQAAARLAFVHELLPVGSRGLRHEALQLAAGIGGRLRLNDPPSLDLAASAGASTCFLASLAASSVPELRAATHLPVYEIGRIAG
jgi:hypothetical protein